MRWLSGVASALLFLSVVPCSAAEDPLPALVERLKTGSPDIKGLALFHLGRLGPQAEAAAPAVVEALRDGDAGVRAQAAVCCAQLQRKHELLQPALAMAATDPDAYVRVAALDALWRLGGPPEIIVRAAIPGTRDGEQAVRLAAASALTHTRSLKDQPELMTQAGTELVRLLADPYVLIRAAAASSLGGLQPVAGAAVPELMKGLADSDHRVRRNAAGALGGFGAEAASAFDPITALLADRDQEVRRQAAASLQGINADAALDKILATLRHPDPLARATAAESLARYGANEKAIQGLIQALGDGDNDVRFRAVLSVTSLRDKGAPAIPALTNLLNDRNCLIRQYAAEALGQVAPPGQPLGALQMTAQQDWFAGARAAAAASLVRLSTPPPAKQ